MRKEINFGLNIKVIKAKKAAMIYFIFLPFFDFVNISDLSDTFWAQTLLFLLILSEIGCGVFIFIISNVGAPNLDP